MESKLIKVKTDGDILRDAYIISGLEIDGSEYVVYYIDRDDGENDNIFVSKLIKNNDGTYNMLNIENANEKINISNTVKQIVKYAIDDTEHDVLDGDSITLGTRVIKMCSVLINKEQVIDIQKTYITTVKKSVTNVAKDYYNIPVKVETQVVSEEIFPATDNSQIFASVGVTEVQQPQGSIVSSVTSAPVQEPAVVQTVPTAVEPVLPTLEVVQNVTPQVSVVDPVVNPTPIVTATPVNVQTNTPVLDIPAGMIQDPVVQNVTPSTVVTPAVEQPVVQPSVAVVSPTPVVVTPVNTVVSPTVVPAQPVVTQPVNVVNPTPAAVVTPASVEAMPSASVAVTEEPTKLVLDASKESNLNSALGEISKESITVADINAIKDFGEDDTSTVNGSNSTVPPVTSTPTESKKAGFANSKFFMFVAVGFFIASCVFMGYEAFSYYQIVK